MKSNENLRKVSDALDPEEVSRKATKLPPLKKSGKEKKSFYRELEDEDDDLDLKMLHKRESILDYYDDGDEDDWDDEEEDGDEFDEDWEDDWDDEENEDEDEFDDDDDE